MKQQLMLVAMLSVGTALTTMGRLKPVAASMTPPASYDYSYIWDATATEQYLNVNGVDSIPLYTRTPDGVYYNYTSTYNVIDGLNVTQTFNRSNTTWQASGTFYKPDENRIGSSGAVGSISNKVYLKFDNQTNKDYYLNLDLSSTATSWTEFRVVETVDSNTYIVGGWGTLNEFPIAGYTFTKYVVKAYSIVELFTTSVAQPRYFDAWYLKDLGISDAYQAGLDAETDGILTDYLGTDAQQIGWVLIGIAAILFAFKGGK